MRQYLAGPLVGSHLQTDGCAIHGRLDLSFGVIQVPPGAVCTHPCLASTLVGPHLKRVKQPVSDRRSRQRLASSCNLWPAEFLSP